MKNSIHSRLFSLGAVATAIGVLLITPGADATAAAVDGCSDGLAKVCKKVETCTYWDTETGDCQAWSKKYYYYELIPR